MAYTTVPTYTTNQLITASHANTYWRDNINQLWPFTTAGDLAYASGATTLSRLGIGTAGQVLKTNSGETAPEWGDSEPITKRQGGDASDWWSYGTDNYTPSGSKIQVGVTRFTISSGVTDNSTITFPEAFTNKPIVFVGDGLKLISGSVGSECRIWIGTPATDTVVIQLTFAGAVTATIDVGWMAVGD